MFDILKIKITSIAEEQRIIRAHERKQLRDARRLRIRQALDKSDLTDVQKVRLLRRADKLGVKRVTKPPADSDKFIAQAMGTRESMYDHRRGLAKVQRAAYIAYGFLRGKPFKAIEQFSYTVPPWDEALRNIKKFGGAQVEQVVAQRFEQWVQEAGKWNEKPADWKPQPKRVKPAYNPKG